MFVNSENLCFTTILNIRVFAVQFQRYSSTMHHRTPARHCARIRHFGQMVFQHLLDVFLVGTFVPHVGRTTERRRVIIRHIRHIIFGNHLTEFFVEAKPLLYTFFEKFSNVRIPHTSAMGFNNFEVCRHWVSGLAASSFSFKNESSPFSCGGIPE